MTEDEVEEICKKYDIKNWSLNEETGLVDVDDYVELTGKKLTKLPLNFGNVKGRFWCDNNELTTLKGAPRTVGGRFTCSNNNFTSLEHCPISVGGYFYCNRNELITLKGIPKHIGGVFNCVNNNLPIWEYRWILYVEINGKIKTDGGSLNEFLNKYKNPPKSDLPKLFAELKKYDNNFN